MLLYIKGQITSLAHGVKWIFCFYVPKAMLPAPKYILINTSVSFIKWLESV